MPTYEYECEHCGHAFELSQNMSDKTLAKCPKCGRKIKRLIGSGSGFIFKGSGFYATDYRKKSKAQNSVCPKAGQGCDGCQH